MNCPTCGAPRHCYQDEHVMGEIVDIPKKALRAGVFELLANFPPIDEKRAEEIIEDIHRAMHDREPLIRRADGDFTPSRLTRPTIETTLRPGDVCPHCGAENVGNCRLAGPCNWVNP